MHLAFVIIIISTRIFATPRFTRNVHGQNSVLLEHKQLLMVVERHVSLSSYSRNDSALISQLCQGLF